MSLKWLKRGLQQAFGEVPGYTGLKNIVGFTEKIQHTHSVGEPV
jgi:hypothetical protein